MGQPRKRETPAGGTAGRLAAGRRPRAERGERAERAEPKPAKGGLKGKAKKASTSSAGPVARLMKLVLLLAFMAFLGFAAVLILDVGSTLIGGIRFGDITFADLFDKVSDRVFDRDVPEPKRKTAKPPTPQKPKAPSPPRESARAPAPAPSPEAYADHVAPVRDPEVEQAKQRLNDLLRF